MGIQSKAKKNQRRKINRKNKNRNFEKKCLDINRRSMEDLIVNAEKHKILEKYRKRLQERFNVQIRMPKTASFDSDVIFVSIEGEDSNREYVKKFLAEKVEELSYDPTPDSICVAFNKNKIDVVTLSDSESDSEDISVINLDSTVEPESHDDVTCGVSCSTNSSDLQDIDYREQPKKNKKKAENMKVAKKLKLSESVLIIEEHDTSSLPPLDFIPLISGNNSIKHKNEPASKNLCSNSKDSNEIIDDSIIIIDEPQATTSSPHRLRPIVIDGSNVAMEHGKTSRTFSVKGLKLAVDYFLNRGHTQVTAFVPKFRKSKNPNRSVPTTDVDVLDELERKQHVVFTPSRRVNGRCINSYDDRFIVQLAASNGGIIVSNDYFRDLLDESESFKEAIEQRLLMFCFVGDVFMVPDDPLGRTGPKLVDFLSFPSEDQNNVN